MLLELGTGGELARGVVVCGIVLGDTTGGGDVTIGA